MWVVVVALGLASCSDSPVDAGPPAAKGGGPAVLVSLGGAETAGSDLGFPAVVTSRWTQLLYRGSFPVRSTHVNLAQDQRSVSDGASTQLELATEARPTVATVWFGTAYEEAIATPVDVFEADLTTVVAGLNESGARVFVATDTGSIYDDAIERVVSAEAATAVSMAGLTDPLGTSGHTEAARRFAAAVGKVL